MSMECNIYVHIILYLYIKHNQNASIQYAYVLHTYTCWTRIVQRRRRQQERIFRMVCGVDIVAGRFRFCQWHRFLRQWAYIYHRTIYATDARVRAMPKSHARTHAGNHCFFFFLSKFTEPSYYRQIIIIIYNNNNNSNNNKIFACIDTTDS